MTGSGDLSSFLLPVMRAAKMAGESILSVYAGGFAVELKNDRSPLTEADRRSHTVIADALAALPGTGIPVLSEEGKDFPYAERRSWARFWLVDPLDGTKEFIKQNGEFTVNIALVDDARPVLGVIHVPVKGHLYLAWQGAGAYRLDNGSLCRVFDELSGRAVHEPEQVRFVLERHAVRLTCRFSGQRSFTVVASRSHSSPETEAYLKSATREHPDLTTISAGSSLKFCLIADGDADEYPRFAPTMEWDTAAGQAIVEQAGGMVLDWTTRTPLVYNKRTLVNPWFIARRG